MRALLLFLLIDLGCNVKVLKASEPLHTLPFELYGEKIFFKVTIRDSIQINALFDNGVAAYIHSGTAQKHGFEYSGTTTMQGISGEKTLYKIDTLAIGIGDFKFDLTEVRSQVTVTYLNRRVDLVFGQEWIRNYVVKIDYGKEVIELYDPETYEAPTNMDSFKVVGWGNYPLVQSEFTFTDGTKAVLNMELNVGTEVGFTLDRYITREYNLVKNEPNKGRIMIVGPDGRGVHGMLCRIPNVKIANIDNGMSKGGLFHDGFGIGNPERVHGQLGQPILKFYNIVFSFNTEQVWVESKPELEEE